MPQPNKIPLAFAASGDKNIIPKSTETTGLASWRDGFPEITSAPFSEGGIAPKRADFNGIFNALSAAALWYQQGGVFVYDNATDYEIGNLVIYSGEIYVCKTANGPASTLHSPANDTAETYWGRIYPQNGTFDKMFFSQTSGTYTAPRTGVYRITLKGGGGGGGGKSSSTTGGGGGEGGELFFYTTLVKSAAYVYIIGAGGTAGASDTNGSSGGSSSITIDGTTYTAHGGDGGSRGSIGGQGGGGGVITGGTGTFYSRRGEAGSSGAAISSRSRGPRGGGLSGGSDGNVSRSGQMGCGGHGDGTNSATAGGDGYILIEYAG